MYASVSVTDDGTGMSPEGGGKFFDEFSRARNEHTASITVSSP
jgi:K+-sensing histidine kinase KdpD